MGDVGAGTLMRVAGEEGTHSHAIPCMEAAVLAGKRQKTSQAHADDQEAGKQGRSGRLPSSHRYERTGNEVGTESCGILMESDAGRSGTGRVGNWRTIRYMLDRLADIGEATIWQ